jgi:hypothetical protein
MNETGEMWTLPWHAYLKNLAQGIAREPGAHRGRSRETAGLEDAKLSGAGVPGNSWLGRPRRRLEPMATI